MSFDPRRGKPYSWVTHLTGLVSGEKQCAWAAWIKARYYYTQRPDDNEERLLRWKAEHAEMVRARAEVLRGNNQGIAVRVEDQNKFTYVGKAAIVGGKPDLVAIDLDNSVVIEDCKTGKERESDVVQVAIYLMLMPPLDEVFNGKLISGAVIYKNRVREVTMAEMAGLRPMIQRQVLAAASDVEPSRVPSVSECRYCDIAECPDRALSEPELEPVQDAEF